MPHSTVARAALLSVLLLCACSRSQPQPDPKVLDAHFNKIIADEEAERRRLVEEARDREDVREQEMEDRAENYSENSAN
jgi:hypothetical protein